MNFITINPHRLFFLGRFYIFISSIITIVITKTHLVISILLLELILLRLIILISSIIIIPSLIFLIIVLLCLGACEACVGLALLVKITRSHGNDYVLSLNIKL